MTNEQKQEFTLKISQANPTRMIVILYEIFFAYLEAINKGVSLKEINTNTNDFYPKEIKNKADYETVLNFVKLFDLKFTFDKRYIPEFNGGLELLESLINGILDSLYISSNFPLTANCLIFQGVSDIFTTKIIFLFVYLYKSLNKTKLS